MRLSQQLKQLVKKLDFVPQSKPASMQDIDAVQQFMDQSKRLFVVTGAGISTESGIPDYRSEGVGLYARTDRRPIQYQEFVKSESARQRYWARNFAGWPSWSSHKPNECHQSIAEMEKVGKLHWLVTQNVDALHTKAGSEKITELHGCTHRVMCLSCPSTMTRWQLQDLFTGINPDFNFEIMEVAPDGDVILPDELVKTFQVPKCPNCGGILKPDVTFFGDNVPRPMVEFVFDKLKESDSVLVAGSSLFVFSAYRFINRAREQEIPISVINIGPTRADKFINLKVSAKCGEILPRLNFR